MNTTARLAALTVSAFLTACGGGGDGPVSGSAEGFWVGTSSSGYTVRLAVLENGETWGFYTSGGTIYGALFGNTAASGSSLSGSGTDFYFPSLLAQSSSYSGTVAAKQSIQVTTSGGTSFTGGYSNEYDIPATLSAVAGSYSGTGITATTSAYATTVTINSAGAITASTPLCSGTGSIQPRPTGKGIFNVTVTFMGGSCPLSAAGTTSGVAYYDTANRTLVSLGLNGAKTNGFFWVGAK